MEFMRRGCVNNKFLAKQLEGLAFTELFRCFSASINPNNYLYNTRTEDERKRYDLDPLKEGPKIKTGPLCYCPVNLNLLFIHLPCLQRTRDGVNRLASIFHLNSLCLFPLLLLLRARRGAQTEKQFL
jgi:hypothetical protein